MHGAPFVALDPTGETAMTARDLRRRINWRALGLGLLCAIAAASMYQFNLVRGLESWMLDWCFQNRNYFQTDSRRSTQVRVVLIGLDDASLDELRKPRVYLSPELAEVVAFVHQHGAAAIGLDVLIPDALAGQEGFGHGESGDPAPVARAIKSAGNAVLPQKKQGDDWLKSLPQ